MPKYLIYSNTGLSSKQIGYSAEFIQDCKDKNIEMQVVMCNSVLENCYFNPLKNTLACASCQSRTSELLKQIGVSKNETVNLKKFDFQIDIPHFNSLEELTNYYYEGIDIGRGVSSSIVSYFRDFNINSTKYKAVIELEIKKAINVLLNVKEIIEEFKPDEVYLFNGRFTEVYPLLRYCESIDLNYTSIESGAIEENYELFKNNLPHSFSYRNNKMNELWNAELDIEKKEKIGHDFFKKKRFRDDSIEISFTKEQEVGLLPQGFDVEKNNVLLLNSSEDEQKSIKESKTSLYETQNEAIIKMVNYFKASNDIHFYLRVHPNLGKVENIQMDEINQMKFDNLTIIGPNEVVDTYAILDACDKSIAFGSTVGIESTYWGNVSILMGKSFYHLMPNVCYKPESFEELYELLIDKKLPPKPQDVCLPYGFYYSTFGIKTKYFKYKGLSESTFKGKKIRKWNLSTIILMIKYMRDIKNWKIAYKAIFQKNIKLSDIFRYKV